MVTRACPSLASGHKATDDVQGLLPVGYVDNDCNGVGAGLSASGSPRDLDQRHPRLAATGIDTECQRIRSGCSVLISWEVNDGAD